jgi:hypothetical protein
LIANFAERNHEAVQMEARGMRAAEEDFMGAFMGRPVECLI